MESLKSLIVVILTTILAYFEPVHNVLISTIAYAVAYFYSVTLCKNLQEIFPKSRSIAYLYCLLSIEILTKSPLLNNLIKKKRHDENLA